MSTGKRNIYVVMGVWCSWGGEDMEDMEDMREWPVAAYFDEACALEHKKNAERRAEEIFTTGSGGTNEFDVAMVRSTAFGSDYFIIEVPLAEEEQTTCGYCGGALQVVCKECGFSEDVE